MSASLLALLDVLGNLNELRLRGILTDVTLLDLAGNPSSSQGSSYCLQVRGVAQGVGWDQMEKGAEL